MSGDARALTVAQLHSLAKRHLSGQTSVDLDGFAGVLGKVEVSTGGIVSTEPSIKVIQDGEPRLAAEVKG